MKPRAVDVPIFGFVPSATVQQPEQGIGNVLSSALDRIANAARKKIQDSPALALLAGAGVAIAPKSIPQPGRFGFGLVTGSLVDALIDGGGLGAGEEASIANQEALFAAEQAVFDLLLSPVGLFLFLPMWAVDP